MKIQPIVCKIQFQVELSLWQAIKIRIAGKEFAKALIQNLKRSWKKKGSK